MGLINYKPLILTRVWPVLSWAEDNLVVMNRKPERLSNDVLAYSANQGRILVKVLGG